MTGIFVSYRRSDSAYIVDQIYEHLLPRFGHLGVFKDVDSIALGEDFRHKIAEAVQECDILVAVIGEEWSVATDGDGQRRLDNPDDFVRIEIESAFERDIPLIPVLVEDAPIPSPGELPASLANLSFRNAAKLRPSPDFDADITRLSDAIAKQLGIPLEENAPRLRIRKKLLGGAVLFTTLIAIALILSQYLRSEVSAEALDTALTEYHDRHAEHVSSEFSNPVKIKEMVKTIEDYVPHAHRLDVFRELTDDCYPNYFPADFNIIDGIPEGTPGPESMTLNSWLKSLEQMQIQHELLDGDIKRSLDWWLLYVGFHYVIKLDRVLLIQAAKLREKVTTIPPLSEQLQKAIDEGTADNFLESYKFNPEEIQATQHRGSAPLRRVIVNAYRDWLNDNYNREETEKQLREIMLKEIEVVTKQMSTSSE